MRPASEQTGRSLTAHLAVFTMNPRLAMHAPEGPMPMARGTR